MCHMEVDNDAEGGSYKLRGGPPEDAEEMKRIVRGRDKYAASANESARARSPTRAWFSGGQVARQDELKTKKGRGKITQNVKQICPCERGAREDDGKMLCHSTCVVRMDMPCEKYSAEERKGREVSS